MKLLQKLSSSSIFALLISGLCFLPSSIETGNFRRFNISSNLLTHLMSPSIHDSLVAAISSSIPFVADLIVSCFQSHSVERIGILKRLELFFIVILMNSLILFYVLRTEALQYLPCIYSTREVLFIHVIIKMLKDTGIDILVCKMNYIILILYSLGCILLSFISFSDPSSQIIFGISIFAYSMKLCGTLYLLKLFYNYLKLYSYPLKQNFHIKNLYFKCFILLLACTFFMMISWILFIFYGSMTWQSVSISYLIGYTYLELGFALLISIINGSWTRQMAENTKVI